MNEKEIYKSLNGLKYSDEEIQEYENVKKFSDEDVSRISGAIKSKYGLGQIKKMGQKISTLLNKNEKVEKTIKVRDIESIELITLFGAFGLTTFKSDDFGIFKILFFTNERVFFGDLNYLNEPIVFAWVNRDELETVEFTNKKIRVKNKEDKKKISFSRWTFKVIFADLILLFSILNALFNKRSMETPGFFWIVVFIAVIYRLIVAFQQKYLDALYIIFNDGRYIKCLIASDDYSKCREYLKKYKK